MQHKSTCVNIINMRADLTTLNYALMCIHMQFDDISRCWKFITLNSNNARWTCIKHARNNHIDELTTHDMMVSNTMIMCTSVTHNIINPVMDIVSFMISFSISLFLFIFSFPSSLNHSSQSYIFLFNRNSFPDFMRIKNDCSIMIKQPCILTLPYLVSHVYLSTQH